MLSAAAVVACALALLGESERTMPRIALVDAPPIGTSANVEAFVRHGDNTIYLVTSSPAFRETQRPWGSCGELTAMKKLASIIAHEEWHIRHGPDERAAYEAQLTTLIRLGVPPGSALYAGVVRSMQAVLKKHAKKKPELVLAGRQ